MVWKINKNRRSGRRISKEDLEKQAKLKSCLKTKDDLTKQRDTSIDSSKLVLDDGSLRKNREQSERSAKSGSTNGARTSNSNLSVDSKGSGSSSCLGLTNKRRVSSEQPSIGSRSWDRDSRRSEAAQSTQTSERSSVDSKSQVREIKKKVHFSSIHIRDYERVVGDNPSCTIGPPVGIGWKYNEAPVIDIDTFESGRSYRKSTSRLVLTREEREALLLNWGASFHDIVEAVRSNLKIKNQRRQTVTNLGKVERIEEAFESATRKLKGALMLRRSTGNKLKRLQEQANLAQSALASLKIAEDRALSEIRGKYNHVEAEEETNSEEDFDTYHYHTAPIENNEVLRTHMIIPAEEEEDERSRRYSLAGNSTTPSEMEIERFYRELELEMFGEEDMPSMVGQTLEVRLRGERSRSGVDDKFMPEDVSVASGMTERFSVGDGLNDALLEKEQNVSMISEYLLEDADNDVSKVDHASHDQGEEDRNQYYYSSQPAQPMHEEQEPQHDHFGWGSMGPSDFSNWNGSSEFVESQEPYVERQRETMPLHAGMTMFDDCALLGDAGKSKSYRRQKRRSSRRKKDTNAGPKVQYIPPPTHFSLSHWMDGPDPEIVSPRGHDTITISEEIFHDKTQMERQYYNPSHNNNGFVPSYY